MRIIIYTGKGGVGKTTMAAATACKIAGSGKRVLIMSTDQAHSLGDAFDRKIGRDVTEITEYLGALEVDTVYESERSWGNIKDYFKQLLTLKGGSGIEVEELLVFPGLEELFSMFKILEMYESGRYDTIIVDCAPTGETLSLLRYPERLSGLIEKILPIKRIGVKTVGKVVESTMKIPMPKDSVFDDIEYLMDKMKRLQELLLNKDIVSLRVVTTPEKIVLSEAKQSATLPVCIYITIMWTRSSSTMFTHRRRWRAILTNGCRRRKKRCRRPRGVSARCSCSMWNCRRMRFARWRC